jgi:hypothetical protein
MPAFPWTAHGHGSNKRNRSLAVTALNNEPTTAHTGKIAFSQVAGSARPTSACEDTISRKPAQDFNEFCPGGRKASVPVQLCGSSLRPRRMASLCFAEFDIFARLGRDDRLNCAEANTACEAFALHSLLVLITQRPINANKKVRIFLKFPMRALLEP